MWGVLRALTGPMEASGRHVRLSLEGVDRLCGPGHRLAPVRDLSQPGQFVCAERVQLCGRKRRHARDRSVCLPE